MKFKSVSKAIFTAITLLCSCCIASVNCPAQQSDPVVCLQTSKGPIYIRVFSKLVRNSTASFLDLVNRGFYNGLTFHRVEDWVIQGGDPQGNGTGVYVDPESGRPRYLPLEVSNYLRHNAPGVVALARSNNPNSNSCQFYITKRPAPQLDGQYTIIGGVVQGMNAVYNMRVGDRIISAEIVNTGQSTSPSQAPPATTPPAGAESGF